MEEPGSDPTPRAPFGELFGDVPLLREIQRVLLSSSGPVNWELARQVGIATATLGTPESPPSDDDRRSLEETVRAAELHIAELTGLPQPGAGAVVEVVTPGRWVEVAIGGLRELIEPTAGRLADAFGRLQQEHMPSGAPPLAGAMLPQMMALLLGTQAGMTFGELAKTALGQYDLAVPREDHVAMYFVGANISSLEREWSLPAVEFRAWVALHEVAHRMAFARPWVRDHFESILRDHALGLDLDIEGLTRRIEELDVANPESLSALLESDQALFGSALDDEQRLKLGRVQAFLVAAEGWADHVTDSLGRKLLRSHPQIQEALRRREVEGRRSPLSSLLGVDVPPALAERGVPFCRQVAELTDEQTLATMWNGPDTMPSIPELEEPRLWLARNA